MRLIFIRHAEPDYEHDSLTEKGWREAKLLARRTKDWQVDEFYVSPLGRARDTASFTLREHGKTAEVMDWLHEFQGTLPDGNGGERLCWDLMPTVWTAQPELLQPTGWEASEEKPADFSQFHARFYIRVPESEREAMDHQLGKITWLPARGGYLAGITSPVEAGRVLGASPRPVSAWPIFE